MYKQVHHGHSGIASKIIELQQKKKKQKDETKRRRGRENQNWDTKTRDTRFVNSDVIIPKASVRDRVCEWELCGTRATTTTRTKDP